MATKPSGESVQARVHNALRYILMIEHIPDLPTDLFFYYVANRFFSMSIKETFDIFHVIGNYREERVLIDNPDIN